MNPSHYELRQRIRRLHLAMSRYTFRAKTPTLRHYVAKRIATRLMALEHQLPSNRPIMRDVIQVGDFTFYAIKRFSDGSVRYSRSAEVTEVCALPPFDRPDIFQPYRHLFD